MRISTNIAAHNTARQLGINSTKQEKPTARLSSGYRINSAADDAAGLAISEKLRTQIRGLGQGSRNAQDGISLVQTADGGMQGIHALLQRQRELLIQGMNGTNQELDKAAIQLEINEITKEVSDIAYQTKFNEIPLLCIYDDLFRPIIDYNYFYEIETADVTTYLDRPTPLVPAERYFDLSVEGSPAFAEMSLAGINPNGDVSQLHGKSFEINRPGLGNVRYNFVNPGSTLAFDSGRTITLPTGMTVQQYLQSASFLDQINRNASGVSVAANYRFTNVTVTPAGTVRFSGPLIYVSETVLASPQFDGPMIPWPNEYYTGTVANGWSISSQIGVNLNMVNGSPGSEQMNNAFRTGARAEGQFTLNMRSSYTGADYTRLLLNTITIGGTLGRSISFTEGAPGAGQVQVYDGISGDELAARILAVLESPAIGFNITNDPLASFTGPGSLTIRGWIDAPASFNSPPGTFPANVTVDEISRNSGDYTPGTNAGWGNWGPYESFTYSIPGRTLPLTQVPEVIGSGTETYTILTVTWDMPPAAGVYRIAGRDFIIYDSNVSLPPLPGNTASQQYQYSAGAYPPANAIDINTLTQAQWDAMVSDAIKAINPVGSVVDLPGGGVTVTRSGTGYSVSSGNGTGITYTAQTRTWNPGTPGTGTPAARLFTSGSQNLARETELDIALNIAAIKTSGAGFVYQGVAFEFFSGTQRDATAVGINITNAEDINDFMAAIQSAMDVASAAGRFGAGVPGSSVSVEVSVHPTDTDTVTLVMKNRPGTSANTYRNGIWRYDGLFTQPATMQGGTATTKPGTVIDFAGVSKHDLIGTGFQVTCASCPNQWINVIFLDKAAPADFPEGFTGIDADGNSVDFRNIVVDMSGFSQGTDGIAEYIKQQLDPILTHFTGVDFEPPNKLIFEDKRYGNLPPNEVPGRAKVIPGILSNFDFTFFDREPVFGAPPAGAGDLWIQYGANEGDGMWITRYDCRIETLGVEAIAVEPLDEANNSLGRLDNAINMVSLYRARAGSEQNRLEFAKLNVDNSAENMAAAESRIRDADMAKEMADFTKLSIIKQSATAMLAQANTIPDNILRLLG